jgi:hypothetical protein
VTWGRSTSTSSPSALRGSTTERFTPDADVHEIFILFISDFSNSHELGALATPEPGTLLLLGSTFAGLAAYARRKRTRGATAGLS